MKQYRWSFVLLGSLLSCACAKYVLPNPGDPAMGAIKKALAPAPVLTTPALAPADTTVNQLLMPQMHIAGKQDHSIRRDLNVSSSNYKYAGGKKFNLSVKDVPVKQFFMSLVHNTHHNIVLDPTVTGQITLNLQQVTLPEVLAAVEDVYDFQIKPTPYGILVSPPSLDTQVFVVNYVNAKRQGHSQMSVEADSSMNDNLNDRDGRRSNGNYSDRTNRGERDRSDLRYSNDRSGASVSTNSTVDFWTQLSAALNAIIADKKGRRVIVDQVSGVISVTATHRELKQVARFLDIIQRRMTQQVVLEAKIIEVRLNQAYQAGIDWKILGFSTDTEKVAGQNIHPFSNIMTLNTSTGRDFRAVLRMISNQGNVQVLSSPRVSTLNNQKAVIKVGQNEYYLTGTNSTNATTTSATTTAQNVQFQSFFSGISLDVTPQIAQDNSVILHIHPLVSEVSNDTKEFVINDKKEQYPLAKTRVRESDSIVRAMDGQVIVLGGLMTNSTDEGVAAVPFANKVPVFGSLFRRTDQHAKRSELIILLKPTVIASGTYHSLLKEAQKTVSSLDRGYKFGAFPDRFGNLGEFAHRSQPRS